MFVAVELEPHYDCAMCGLSFPLTGYNGQTHGLCRECHRGPLGRTAGDLARRLAGTSQWEAREVRLADMLHRHGAVVALLEAAMKIEDGLDVDRLHQALVRELTAPLMWHGPEHERRLFRAAIGRGPLVPV